MVKSKPASPTLSTVATVHVVNPSDGINFHSQAQAQTPEGGKGNKGEGKGKGKGKGKGNARGGNNHVRDGSPAPASAPARELASGTHHEADHWDDLRRAWVVEHSQQSQKGGHQGTPNHNHNHHKQQHYDDHGHPSGQRSRSGAGPNRQGHGGGQGSGKGQKRRVESVMNDTWDGEHPAKRHQSGKPPPAAGSKHPHSGPSSVARPHPDFWHPDGSVVVEVERTKFRLHQSMLQKHSAYFALVFQKKGKHRHGGRAYLEVEVDKHSPNGHLPVYHVTETTADDFATLLTVIEEPMKYADEVPSMPDLAAVLRAARALSFDAQRKWAERIFERMWPATLDALTTDAIPHAAAALTLARTCNLRSVQKRASYELLRMPTFGRTIVAGVAAAEGGRETNTDEEDVGSGELARADLIRLLHAREQLGLAWAEVAGKAPMDFACPRSTQTQTLMQSERGGGGNGGGGCASANVDRVHARWAELVHTTGLYVERMIDPLMGLQDLMGIPWKDEGFCKKCINARRNAWDGLRRKLWDNLDVWLELTVEKVD